MTSLVGAYRATEARLPPRVADVVWRQRVSRAAKLLFWTWVARAALAVVVPVLITFDAEHYVRIYRVGYAIPAVISAVGCWLLAARRPGRPSPRRNGLGVALRALATLGVALTLVELCATGDFHLPAERVLLYVAWAVSIGWTVLQLLYFRSLFVEVGNRRGAHVASILAIVFGSLEALSVALTSWTAVQIAFASAISIVALKLVCWIVPVIAGAVLIRRLSLALRLVEHEWWFDERAGWASLGRSADGPSEIVEASGERRLIETWGAARDWLLRAGYFDERRAIAERLVMGAPAPIQVESD